MKRALLIGSNGQVGTEISRLWRESPSLTATELVGLTHADLEITDRRAVEAMIEHIQPRLVINTAGFLRVDECEDVPDKAFAVNAIGAKYLAESAARHGSFLVQFSTDYVFDGHSRLPYVETDPTAPVNCYGLSKLAGEHFVRYLLPELHLIVRTSGVFGPAGSTNKGGNFIETMLRLAQAGRQLKIVDDQTFSPTYAPDLAQATLRLIEAGTRGVVHVTNAGETSWYDFAKHAFSISGLEPDVRPVTSVEYASAAMRPRFSVLDNRRAIELAGTPMRTWKDALDDYLAARPAFVG